MPGGAGARGVPWADVLLSAVAGVSWALIGMAGTAALGLHLLDADAAGAPGPMTAAVVALGAGGAVTPSGDVSAFGLTGAEADTALALTPLGVGLVGALLLAWLFLRSLRTAGAEVAPAELLARAGTVVGLTVAALGGLAWAGHDVVTLDGAALGLDDLPGGGAGGGGGVSIPGLGDLGGLLPDRVGDLVDARAAVGFTVDTVPTLLGGLVWSAGVLLVALLASRRTPLPRGWDAVHRVVRPAVSAVVTVLLLAVAAGCAAAAYAAIGDDHPRRIAGAALLGAPNGVWLGVGVGLWVPWDGRASGVLTQVLPDPLDDLLGSGGDDRPVTLARLAELDQRVWLLGVAAAVMMLLAGVLTAVRTPVAVPVRGGTTGTDAGDGARTGVRRLGVGRYVGGCALRLGVATAVALPLVVRLADVSVNASLSVLGVDAFGAGVDLRGHLGPAVLLGAAWGAGAGAVGALLARATGAAGGRATPAALRDSTVTGGEGAGAPVGVGADAGVGADVGVGAGVGGARGTVRGAGAASSAESAGTAADAAAGAAAAAGPYAPGRPHRPPNPATNPYLRLPPEAAADPGPEPEDAVPPGRDDAGAVPPPGRDDVAGAPTVVGPVGAPPPRPRPGSGAGAGSAAGKWPAPPPPPPARGGEGPRGGERPGRAGRWGRSGDEGPDTPPPPPPPRPPGRPPRS
ncbi:MULTISPECIES: streptophobe family protein [unclassified Streptomyces]|uniref:streptophobe family protein n=1 Tax=unclassified Streptomyces TaxID=2593676 RepID=UPI003806BD1C